MAASFPINTASLAVEIKWEVPPEIPRQKGWISFISKAAVLEELQILSLRSGILCNFGRGAFFLRQPPLP